MSAHPNPNTSLNGNRQYEGTQNVNGKKSPVPLTDIVSEMMPKPVEPTTVEGVNYGALLDAARVRPTDTVDEDTACLLIEKDGINSIIGTMGNLSTITGRAKAKKTFAVSFAVAAAVVAKLILGRIKGALPEGKHAVLLFDTEQSRHHVLKVVKRICRLCGIDDPPNLIVYSLRPFAPQDRLKAIEFALNNTPGIGLVVIDGVRDLAVDPVLDSEQASQIMTHLLRWTDRLNIHIMCVLHQNKNDTNLRGHIGTELVNKSETVITVTRDPKDKEISHVEAEYCRNREFEPFCFSIDDTGLPYLVEGEEYSNGAISRLGKQGLRKADLPSADSMTPETITTITDRAFGREEYLGYSQLRTAIIEASEFVGSSLSKGRAEVFIKRIVDQGYIVKFKPGKSKYDVYRLTTDSDLFQSS